MYKVLPVIAHFYILPQMIYFSKRERTVSKINQFYIVVVIEV